MGDARRTFLTVFGCLALASCSAEPGHTSTGAQLETASAVSAPPVTGLASTSGSPAPTTPNGPAIGRFVPLPVGTFPPSLVYEPAASNGQLPLVIVTHGAGGRPGPHCERYRELTGEKAFLLCTSGRTIDAHLPVEERGFFYDGHKELGRELVLAVEAVEAKFGDRVDKTNRIFAGYSQGATMGILALQQGIAQAVNVRRILLVEGGSAEWNIAVSENLKRIGVDRVAIVCGQTSCREAQEKSVRWMRRGGLEVQSPYAPGAGHTYEGTVRPLVDASFAWLVEDDERFLGAPARKP